MSNQLARLTAAFGDRYRIDRELGAGGMATVYLAEDLKHNRMVAVKVLKPELAVAIAGNGRTSSRRAHRCLLTGLRVVQLRRDVRLGRRVTSDQGLRTRWSARW